MKKIFYILVALLVSVSANAQFTSDLVVYNPSGEIFKLYLNSKLINNQFSNKVRANNLISGEYKINIVFQSKKMPNLQQDIFIQENAEIACEIYRGKYGVYGIDVFQAILYFDKNSVPTMPVEENPPIIDEGGVYCDLPMSETNFATGLQSIKNKISGSEKLDVAKQIANSNCLLSAQVKQILESLTFESEKLEFAKFAYTHTFDPENYFVVNDVFNFSSSTRELSGYIDSLED